MKQFALFLLMLVLVSSCMRALSPAEAASKSYKKCHPIK